MRRSFSNTHSHSGYYDLDKIKEIPITDVLSDLYGIEVQKNGRTRAYCAIRDEKTPSCCLYLDTNSFCDYGDANRGGNVINLVQYLSNCEFKDAIQMLAERYGIAPEKTGQRILPTNAQYAKIGIQADMVSKNFSFDIERFGLEKTREFAERYRMTVQELAESEPKTYHNMLKNVAVPQVVECRNIYYRNLYTSYLLCSSFGADLTDSMVQELTSELDELQKTEEIMQRAITDKSLLNFTPKQYNVKKDLNDILNGKIEFEVGNLNYMDLKKESTKQNKNLIYKKVKYSEWTHANSDFGFPYAAYVNGAKQEVNIITQADNRLKLEDLFSKGKSTEQQNIKQPETEKTNIPQQKQKFNTVVVNMFAGPGAGKTTCAWEVASALKKKGLVVEYVPEVAKEYVWDNNFEMLDGSVKNQSKLFEEQDRRVQRLMGKVEVIVTDSPILLNNIYVKETDPAFKQKVTERFKKQNNFNVFVERGRNYESEGRIHDYADSVRIDTQIQDLLHDNKFYFKKYTYPQIKQCVENINKYVRKCNGRPIRNEIQQSFVSQYCNKVYQNQRAIIKSREVVR